MKSVRQFYAKHQADERRMSEAITIPSPIVIWNITTPIAYVLFAGYPFLQEYTQIHQPEQEHPRYFPDVVAGSGDFGVCSSATTEFMRLEACATSPLFVADLRDVWVYGGTRRAQTVKR